METHLNDFEELLLLLVGMLQEEAYGVAIMEEMEKQTGKSVNISAVHAALNRMEEQGLLASEMGGATAARGGRRKRIFTLTAAGKVAIRQTRDLRERLFQAIPKIIWGFSGA